MNVRAHVIFSGRVQGVWFRANTRGKAAELGVTGWVRNLPDGTVEAVLEGEKSLVGELIDWCRTSQPHARVDSAMMEWQEFSGDFTDFEILH